jgi:hypothetical protein
MEHFPDGLCDVIPAKAGTVLRSITGLLDRPLSAGDDTLYDSHHNKIYSRQCKRELLVVTNIRRAEGAARRISPTQNRRCLFRAAQLEVGVRTRPLVRRLLHVRPILALTTRADLSCRDHSSDTYRRQARHCRHKLVRSPASPRRAATFL